MRKRWLNVIYLLWIVVAGVMAQDVDLSSIPSFCNATTGCAICFDRNAAHCSATGYETVMSCLNETSGTHYNAHFACRVNQLPTVLIFEGTLVVALFIAGWIMIRRKNQNARALQQRLDRQIRERD